MKGMYVAIVLAGLLLGGMAEAAPGASSALNGAEDVYAGVFPPPGLYLINYQLYYGARTFKDADGHSVPGSDATLAANAVRVVYSSTIEFAGGNLGWHAIVPLMYKNATIPPTVDGSLSGLGDMYLSPIIIGWHFDNNFHLTAGLDVILPTGKYSRNRTVNLGSNQFTFEPVVAVSKIFDNGLVLDAKLMYDIHTRNNATSTRTGDQFHMDYAATVPVSESTPLRAGISGYYFKSVRPDRNRNGSIHNSREQTFAIGPLLRLDASERTSVTFKAQFESNTENRFEGNTFWLKIVHAF